MRVIVLGVERIGGRSRGKFSTSLENAYGNLAAILGELLVRALLYVLVHGRWINVRLGRTATRIFFIGRFVGIVRFDGALLNAIELPHPFGHALLGRFPRSRYVGGGQKTFWVASNSTMKARILHRRSSQVMSTIMT